MQTDAAPRGYLEAISPAFASGWAAYQAGAPAGVAAFFGDELLGLGTAGGIRPDLQHAGEQGGFQAGVFCILFRRMLTAAERDQVHVRVISASAPLSRLPDIRLDPAPPRRIFILGSPRSGTSELGATLARVFQLPWLGELHAAHIFAEAAAGLRSGTAFGPELTKFLADHQFADTMLGQARLLYYGVHGSASFLDKTPGVPMIRAAPFLAQCFPDAKFICLRRNGISNLCSRMVKFGADFDFRESCHDWSDCLNDWAKVRVDLPHSLDLRQEDMQDSPDAVAASIAAYLEAPDRAQDIADSLAGNALERTGAGMGRYLLEHTGWDAEQREMFQRICGGTMTKFGYPM